MRRPIIAVLCALAVLVAPKAGLAEGERSSPEARSGSGSYHGAWPPPGAGPGGAPWAVPAPNPALASSCGVEVGLLIDRSGSIERAGQADAMRAAAIGLVEALAGTPSSVGVWSFGVGSAAGPGDEAHPALGLRAVGGEQGRNNVDALRSTIEAIPIGDNASTNWQAGFDAVHEASEGAGRAPDLLVVLTDGRPTVHQGALESGSTTDVEDVDAGIAAANRVKGDGTRVLAIGIGDQVDATTLGLIAEPTAWDGTNLAGAGYALTSFDALAHTLRSLATELCGGTLTVHKTIVDGVGLGRAGEGWVFGVSTPVDPTWSQMAVTDENGDATFDLPNLEPMPLAIDEVAQPGFRLRSDDIVCTNASGAPPMVTPTETGAHLVIGPTDIVRCTFPNEVRGIDLAIAKSDADRSVPVGGEVSYALTVRNAGASAATGVVVSETVPAWTSVDLGVSDRDGINDGWRCAGRVEGRHLERTGCTFALGELAASSAASPITFVVRSEAMPPTQTFVQNRALVADDGRSGPDLHPGDNEATDTTPVVVLDAPDPADEPDEEPAVADPTTSTSAPASVATPVSVLGVSQQRAAPGSLPRTGASSLPLVIAGLAFAIGGGLLTSGARSLRVGQR